MIRDILSLEADPELFLEKTLDDIEFLDHTLEILLQHIRDNDRFLERETAFDNLADLEWQFTQILGAFFNGHGSISAAGFPSIRDKINFFRTRSLERRKTMEYSGTRGQDPSSEPLVSSDELSELLKEF
jgi:hypothetical protein